MFWPFNFRSSRDSNVSKSTNLDPTLQEFIKAQGPEKYTTVLHSGSRQASKQDQKQSNQEALRSASSDSQLLSQPSTLSTPASLPTPDPKTIPTLFPDGRYAYLWKGYRSLATVDAETKTSAEKIADVLMAYNDRDNSVKRAGLENCWPEGLASQRCNQNPPTAHDRLTLCRDYTRSLERCLLTQVRFMRALGYLSEPGRPKEKEEDIQLHADDLYRRMMKQEKMVEDARCNGKPIPVFAPVLASEISKAVGPRPVIVGTQATDGTMDSPTLDDAVDEPDNPALPPEAQVVGEKTKRNMRERLKKLSPEERIIERLAMANEIRAANQTGKFYSEMALEQKAEREARRKAGTASIGDYVSGWLGW